MKISALSSYPVLQTERLILREVQPADAADVLVFRGDAYVQRFNSAPLQTIEEATLFIADARNLYDAQGGIGWGITLRGEDRVLGGVSLHSWSQYHRRAEVGYDLARARWGQGIGSEAVRAVLHFGFTQLNLNRIEAATIADNHESVNLLKKLGFTLEGIRRSYSWEDDGTFHDSAMFGLLRDEFIG
ncbi:MAG: N-acetyltransferase [Caldilinea sp. CFX5]|nr:N-acetyltransferase [Caldilinea sp. CFX5]